MKKIFSHHLAFPLLTLIAVFGFGYGCGLAFKYWFENYSSIYVIGRPQKIFEDAPVWSHDGEHIAFSCGYYYPSDGWDNRSFNNPQWGDETREVCILNLRTKEVKRLTYGRDKGKPFWSPDGSLLAWPDYRNDMLVIYNFEKGEVFAQIKQNTPWCGYRFSQDSKKLVSLCGDVEINIKARDVSYFPLPAQSDSLLLSPDGQYLAYTRYVNKSTWHTVMVVKKNGKEFFQSGSYVYSIPFEWAPKEPILFYEQYDYDAGEIIEEYVFLHVPTGEFVNFKPKDDIGVTLSWSPMGDKIAVKTDEETITILDVRFETNPFSATITKEKTYFIKEHSTSFFLYWSPDGKHIAFTAHELKEKRGDARIYYPDKIWLLDLETGEQSPLIPEEKYENP